VVDKPVAKKPVPAMAKPLGAKPIPVNAAPVKTEVAPVAKMAAPLAAPTKPVVAKAAVPQAPVAAPVAIAAAIVDPAPAAAPVAAPVAVPAPQPQPQPQAAATVAAVVDKGNTVMNDTINQVQNAAKTFANEAGERTSAMFGDLNGRAKDVMSKGTKAVEDMVEFSKGNIEALVASGRVAAKGTEEIAKYSAEYGRKMIEDANATAKQFAAVKSPTEFFQLQSEVAKKNLDSMVAEASKFTEHYMKLIGEIAQPLQNRAAVAVEKVKSTVSA
jgi:phasin family protein